ncbi:hypothetical protein DEIPH_ctg004orf0023 [Deinococcus phoenicis]|uniref:DUF1453 domain-containing protein n=1 Tax=Deinococcus phoenicis TaxID=1476583 RepID=A0A016QTT9_9DEIO|nr:hypothetical protein [Deinococcus phoenicis]EYB69520.1 hypothetical protein DEIPH_ctg004orf0023 [Deinococcus phoenicis]
MTAAHPALVPSLLGLTFMGLTLLRRFQRFATPQALDGRGRLRLSRRPVILLVLAGLVLLAPHTLAGYGAALLGAVSGAGLALWSAHHTRFEYGADGSATRYVPNAWIGGGVFLLFVLRLLWRLWPFLTGQVQGAPGFDPAGFAGGSPLTTGLFLVFVAYQTAYSWLVLRAARKPRLV